MPKCSEAERSAVHLPVRRRHNPYSFESNTGRGNDVAYKVMPVYNIEHSVGQGGVNQQQDVRLIQTMLNELAIIRTDWAPAAPLPVDGFASQVLRDWIIAYQKHVHAQGQPIAIDGRVDPMAVTKYGDWSSGFGGSWSTMFTLNYNLRKRAASAHEGLAGRLGIGEMQF